MKRKGQIEDFGIYIFVVIAIAIIGVFLMLVVNAKMSAKEQKFAQDLSFTEGLYSTRVILNHEISPGYKVYDFARDVVASGDYDRFRAESIDFVKAYDPKGTTKTWFVGINDRCYLIPAGPMSQDKCRESLRAIPRVTVPNPSGDNILVVFKPYKEIDTQNIQRVAYGFKAGQLQGYNPDEIPTYSLDGKELAKIENIPNIVCEPEGSEVGRYCAASPELVAQLKIVSEEYLVPEGVTMVVYQAYRTYEIQKKLFDKNCDPQKNGYDSQGRPKCVPGTCNPGPNPSNPNICPHMISGAIDMYLCKDGQKINHHNPRAVEDVMCRFGFVRYVDEAWHFEYGTSKWEEAIQRRANGDAACTYGQLKNYRKNSPEGCENYD